MELVLIRHGESVWNMENRFTGWMDVDLSEKGKQEAIEAGKILKQEGFEFDVCYTSLLTRAIKTLNAVLEEMGCSWLPVIKDWHLNERHYGALQGLNKAETAQKYGDEQVKIWRRSFATQPPALTENDASIDRRYEGVEVPKAESLKDTIARTVPYFEAEILSAMKSGKRVVIAAHGNSIRALVKHFDNLSEEEITDVNIPTGTPLVYTFDENFAIIGKRYLGDAEAIAKKQEAVANQGKGK